MPAEPKHDQVAEEKEAAAGLQVELPQLIAGSDEVTGAVPSTDSESSGGDGAMPIAAAPISQSELSASPTSPSAGEVASARQDDITADPDRFFDSEYAPVLRQVIHRVVDREGPVTLHDSLAE